MTNDIISDIYCDALDVRSALPEEVLNLPKDNDGSDITVRDCLDNIIETLEGMQS